MHIYAFFYPYSQWLSLLKIKSWRRLQLLRLWSLCMFPARRICNTKSQGSYWVRRLGRFRSLDMLRTTKNWHFDGWIFVVYRYAYVLVRNVWQPSALQVKDFCSIVISTPFGWFYRKTPGRFFKWGWTSLHLTLYIKGCGFGPPEPLMWIVVINSSLSTWHDATFRLGDGICTWFTHAEFSIYKSFGGEKIEVNLKVLTHGWENIYLLWPSFPLPGNIPNLRVNPSFS